MDDKRTKLVGSTSAQSNATIHPLYYYYYWPTVYQPLELGGCSVNLSLIRDMWSGLVDMVVDNTPELMSIVNNKLL